MSATLTAPTLPQTAPRTETAPAGFGNLLLVEARKLVNTRAGRWLLLIALMMSAGATAVAVWVFPTGTLAEVFLFSFMPLGILLPVCAILATTAEWSQRTGLTTFALEPRRWRVAAAKLVVLQVAAVAVLVAATGIAYAAAGIASLGDRTWNSWALDAATLGGVGLSLSLMMLQAAAFGFLLLNTPAAIVLFFVVPQLWSNAVSFVPALAERKHWLDLDQALAPILDGAATSAHWGYFLAAVSIWVLLPLAAGIVRFLRGEVK